MPKINYVLTDGTTRILDVDTGTSVRDAAIDENVPGIEGECGGQMNCATCHVYVDLDWVGRLADPAELEDEMLEGTAAERRPGSRLSCQLRVADDWDGLVVTVPESQY
jgi:2Fe-2S ferredoxin